MKNNERSNKNKDTRINPEKKKSIGFKEAQRLMYEDANRKLLPKFQRDFK